MLHAEQFACSDRRVAVFVATNASIDVSLVLSLHEFGNESLNDIALVPWSHRLRPAPSGDWPRGSER
jgi:hypothetical protein